MDRSLSSLGTPGIMAGAVVFFEDIDLGLGVGVSSMMMKLQVIALAFECIPSFCSVNLFSDNQAALDACKLEFVLACPDFRNWCWVKCRHIVNVIHHKNLNVNWIKVKGHSSVPDNEHADALARTAAFSNSNSRHFVYDIFRSVHCLCWEVGSGSCILADSLHANIDWSKSSLQLYNKYYPNVVCLFCGNVKILDHVFSCPFDVADCTHLMEAYLLHTCVSDVIVGTALCKGFVFNDWYRESTFIFKDSKVAAQNIVFFVCEFCLAFWDDIWLVHAKYRAVMEKSGLILPDGFIPVLVSGLPVVLLAGMIK
ncbi:hypothetical protein G9A89_013652 [Geosiphon pyriformis]|nr:hypothetical protein G9A89_013652 [Geosiphon pyriformis]